MESKITLTKIDGYELRKSDCEGKSSWVDGYFKDKAVAVSLAEKEGGYNPIGNVIKCDNLYTDGDKIYFLTIAGSGEFKDADESVRENVIAEAKKKLTPADMELLGLK